MEENTKQNGKGFAITSLVTGILSLVTIEFIIVSTVFAILAIIFGLLAKNKGENKFSKSGIAIGLVSIGITVLLYLFLEVFNVSIFVIPSWYK